MSFSEKAAELAADIQRVLATLQDLRDDLDCLDALCSAAIASAEQVQEDGALAQYFHDQECANLDAFCSTAIASAEQVQEDGALAQYFHDQECANLDAFCSAAIASAEQVQGDGALALYLQDQDAILVARQELSEIAALRCMENLDRFENCIRCPHCRWPIEIVELNCTIFNCGAVLDLRGNYYQVGQHLTSGVLDRLKRELGERFLGCGRQFRIVGATMVGGKLVGGNVVQCEGL
jgi:hypothetical protein